MRPENVMMDPELDSLKSPAVEDRRRLNACKTCEQLAAVRVMHSDELLQGRREMFILHQGQTYRLLRTRNDKLILQK